MELGAATDQNESEALERSSTGQPLYAALADILTRDILSGRYPPTSILPSEKELTERFGLSRQTVRQALRVLRDQGLIAPRAGIGTIVKEPPAAQDHFRPVNSTEELLQFVEGTEMHLVSRQEVTLSQERAAMLDCKPGMQMSEVSFLRKSKGAKLPMSYVQIYVPLRFAAAQKTAKVINKPIYQNIEKMYGLRVEEIRQDVTATVLDKSLADILKAKVGEAALQITRFFYDASQTLVEVTVSYYPSSRYTQSARFRATAQRG